MSDGYAESSAKRTVADIAAALQLGCVVSVGHYIAYLYSSDPFRDTLMQPGVALRKWFGGILGWDQHRINHDTISQWGILLVIAAATGTVLFFVFRRRRVSERIQLGIQLLGSWFVVWVLADSTLYEVAIPGFGLVLSIVFYSEDPGFFLLRGARRKLLVCTPMWLLPLRSTGPWVSPLAWFSLAVLVLRALVGTVQKNTSVVPEDSL